MSTKETKVAKVTKGKKGKKGTEGTKVVTGKTNTKVTSVTKRISITQALHKRFTEVGPENVKLAEALEIAKKIKPDTAFNSKHLTWHRNYYREKQARLAEVTAQ